MSITKQQFENEEFEEEIHRTKLSDRDIKVLNYLKENKHLAFRISEISESLEIEKNNDTRNSLNKLKKLNFVESKLGRPMLMYYIILDSVELNKHSEKKE